MKKNKTIFRILSFVLLILIIYILENKNFSLKINEKKYAIQYIRKLLLNYLNNTNEYYFCNKLFEVYIIVKILFSFQLHQFISRILIIMK